MNTAVTTMQSSGGLKQSIVDKIKSDTQLFGLVFSEIGVGVRRGYELLMNNDPRMTQYSCLTRIANYLGVARIEDLLEEGEGK